METTDHQVGQVADFIVESDRIIVFTGAGVSTESGIPDFRSPDGLWSKYDPDDFTIEKFLSDKRARKTHWDLLTGHEFGLSEAKPNSAHYAITELEKMGKLYGVITQNVDGLHHTAGSENVIELHGNLRKNKCIQCGRKYESLEGTIESIPPKCPCGGNIRPDVVWFGEMLPQDAINYAFACSQKCDLFFSVGTSAVVHPAASLPLIAKRAGAFVVEVNVSPTEISRVIDESLFGKSGEILPLLVKFFK